MVADTPRPGFDVRLTPRPRGERDGETRSLRGSWEFAAGSPGSPPATGWAAHEVPGEWRRDGFDVADDEVGWYRRSIRLPRGGTDRRVKLRFDAVYSRAVVYVNGGRVGSHEGGYTPFEVDVTEDVRPGANVLHVAVATDSPATDLDWGNVTGGITRDVTLLSVPTCHVSRLDVDTELTGGTAVVRTTATVVNGGDSAIESVRLDLELTDPDGERTGEATRTIEYLEPGGECEVTVEIVLDSYRTWNPEAPALYDLGCDVDTGTDAERIERSVGLREVAVEGDRLLLNGEAVTLRGVNWEETHPEYGGAVPPRRTRSDARRLREANVNYVRTSHHPPSEAFLAACDELGILVELEAPITFLRGEEAKLADDPEYRDLVCRQVLEAVERDRNRTSVCLWSLANESAWGDNFEAALALLRERDPSRPTTFNWAEYDDADGCDVANHHYPATRPDSDLDAEDFADIDRPVLFDEFAHLFCYADAELATDPGIRDDWVRVFEATWERVRAVDACVGAAVWGGTDHVHPTEYRWGLLDRYRRARPEYWHVKKAYAPVRLREWRVDGSATRVTFANHGEFANLSERTLRWRAGERSGTLDLRAAPGGTATGTLPATPGMETPVEIRVEHPRGFAIDEVVLRPDRERDRRPSPGCVDVTGARTSEAVEARAGDTTVRVDPQTGSVTASHDDKLILDGVGLVASPLQDDPEGPLAYEGTVEHRPDGWTCERVEVAEGTLRIRGSYADFDGEFALEPLASGVEIGYDFTLRNERTLRETGLRVTVPTTDPELGWERDARWSTYPEDHVGRPTGTAPAFPGDRPDDDADRLSPDRPWSRDATRRGSRDFRSTKRNVLRAKLHAGAAGAVGVSPDGGRHVRASVRDGETDLLVLDRSIAGGGLPFLVRHPLLGETPTLEGGTRLTDSVVVRFEAGDD